MKNNKCTCRCHVPIFDCDWPTAGVDVNNPWEAEAACDGCKSEHPQRTRQAFVPPVQWKPADDRQTDGNNEVE